MQQLYLLLWQTFILQNERQIADPAGADIRCRPDGPEAGCLWSRFGRSSGLPVGHGYGGEMIPPLPVGGGLGRVGNAKMFGPPTGAEG